MWDTLNRYLIYLGREKSLSPIIGDIFRMLISFGLQRNDMFFSEHYKRFVGLTTQNGLVQLFKLRWVVNQQVKRLKSGLRLGKGMNGTWNWYGLLLAEVLTYSSKYTNDRLQTGRESNVGFKEIVVVWILFLYGLGIGVMVFVFEIIVSRNITKKLVRMQLNLY